MSMSINISRFVRLAHSANHLHIMARRLGYELADHDHVESRDRFMAMARQNKAYK